MNRLIDIRAIDRQKHRRSHGTNAPTTWNFDIRELNREFALVLMGSKAVVIYEQSTAPIEDRVRILSLPAFRSWFLNRFTEIRDRDGRVKSVTWASAWLADDRRRQYRGIEFYPDPAGKTGTDGYFNLWRGFSVVPNHQAGHYTIFKDHLLNNLCSGDKDLYHWVFGWFSHMVQRPRERIGTALVCRGKMGTGKTKIGEVFGSLFPQHYFLMDDPRYLVGQFNAHMASCLLLQADEGFWAGEKAAEGRLKGLITADYQMIEAKGIDPIRLKNYLRLLITSNEDWVIPAGKDERRFCVLDISPRCAQNHGYFREMEEELASGGREALLADLLAFDLTTINLRQIPRTEALLEQKLRSLDSIESWWLERLRAGTSTRSGETWARLIPCSTLLDDYIATADRTGIKRKAEETSFGIKIGHLIPGIRRVRRSVGMEYPTTRVWCYHLPDLEKCREAFEAELSQAVSWDEADEE
ncbi:primase-helicase family protein [Microvirga soli]|uniref:primase-helicase family protein n=1 Tax=Microvirga soli TaxID=1854496 RepID=UPI00191F45B2|nr:primase-helicase family protein [Microvirga soli]